MDRLKKYKLYFFDGNLRKHEGKLCINTALGREIVKLNGLILKDFI